MFHSRNSRIETNQQISPREVVTIRGDHLSIPDAKRLVHLQFRRFAGCPICKLHLRSIARRHHELVAAGILEVAVFHSPLQAMLRHQHSLPFAVVADPGKLLYTDFGVETSVRSILDPRTRGAIVRGLRTFGPGPPARGESGLGLPADFLIAPEGRVVACKYGAHADDHWSVDEILALANYQYRIADVANDSQAESASHISNLRAASRTSHGTSEGGKS
jgi:peroxiredoxin